MKNQIGEDNLSVVAAGVSFYTFLSIFPALAAMVSIYALVTEPARLQEHITRVQIVLPRRSCATGQSATPAFGRVARRRAGMGSIFRDFHRALERSKGDERIDHGADGRLR